MNFQTTGSESAHIIKSKECRNVCLLDFLDPGTFLIRILSFCGRIRHTDPEQVFLKQ